MKKQALLFFNTSLILRCVNKAACCVLCGVLVVGAGVSINASAAVNKTAHAPTDALASSITDRVLIVHSGDSVSYQSLEQSFRARLSKYFDSQPNRLLNVKSINLSSFDALEKIIAEHKKRINKSRVNKPSQDINLIVTIGARAAYDVLSLFPAAPVLSVFIPKQTYHIIMDEIAYLESQQLAKLITDADKTNAAKNIDVGIREGISEGIDEAIGTGKRFAIYLDQPDERLVLLAKTIAQLNKKHKSDATIDVGLFTGQVRKQVKDVTATTVKNSQCAIVRDVTADSINSVEINKNLMAGVSFHQANVTSRYLKRALKKSDVIIVTPQLVKQSPNAIKWMVYMAYQRKVPVIGYSKAFSDAGAIASVYSTPEDIGRQGAEWFLENRQLSIKENKASEAKSISGKKFNLSLKKLRESLASFSVYPQYFQVSVNKSVAKTLGYTRLNAVDLQQSLVAFSLNCQDNYKPIPVNKKNQQLTRR